MVARWPGRGAGSGEAGGGAAAGLASSHPASVSVLLPASSRAAAVTTPLPGEPSLQPPSRDPNTVLLESLNLDIDIH